jgi:hypothetical protein
MIRLTSVLSARSYSFQKITCEKAITSFDRKRGSLRINILACIDRSYYAGAEAGSFIQESTETRLFT